MQAMVGMVQYRFGMRNLLTEAVLMAAMAAMAAVLFLLLPETKIP
jgi:hypothetical protein